MPRRHHFFCWMHYVAPSSALRSIMHLTSVSSPSTFRASIPPPAVSLLGGLHFFGWMHHVAPSSALRSIMHLISVFSPSTYRASIPPYVGILACGLHSFPTRSLTECAPSLRAYRIPTLRSGSALTQALPCSPCLPPPRPPCLPIYFFSKFFSRAVAQVLSNRLLL